MWGGVTLFFKWATIAQLFQPQLFDPTDDPDLTEPPLRHNLPGKQHI